MPQRPSGLSSTAQGLIETAGERAGQHRRETLGDDDAEDAAGGQGVRERVGRGGDRGVVVEHLEHAVAGDEVGLAGRHEVGQGRGVALQRDDAVGDPDLVGAALERGEGVGAGVDDRHGIPELGQRHGEAAGAAAEVDDPQRPGGSGVGAVGPGGDGGEHRLPDGGRADRGVDPAAAG